MYLDVHRGQSDDIAAIYARAVEFERYAARMNACSGVLRFGWVDDPETGETRLRLREARFCRVRYSAKLCCLFFRIVKRSPTICRDCFTRS